MPSPISRRNATVLALALLGVLAAALGPGTASAEAAKRLRFACASSIDGTMRYAQRPRACASQAPAFTGARRESVVRFVGRRVEACVKRPTARGTRQSRRYRSLPVGSTRRVRGAGRCSPEGRPNEMALSMPEDEVVWFCANRRAGRFRKGHLRWMDNGEPQPCGRRRFAVYVPADDIPASGPGNPPTLNQAPRANDDSAGTGEDSPETIDVLANDSDPEGAPLTVSSLDTTGTQGTATISNNKVEYDPDGAFEDLGPNETATDAFKYRANDGSQESSPATVTVTIDGANDAPTVTSSSGSTSYTEGDPAATVDGSLTVSDPDDTNLEGARVRISNNFQSGDDLVFVDQNGITGTYNSGTGVLTLTGTASRSDYQSALRSVEFRTTDDNPSSSKVASFRASDGDVDGPEATKTLSITPVNDAPTLNTTNSALSYTEGDGHVSVDNGITTSDPDSTQMQGATVQVTSNFASADDELAFTNTANISGSYNDSTGTLTLSGTDTVANYQAALRSVTYENSSQNPSGSKTVSFQATDAEGAASNVATRNVNLSGTNDAPVVTTSANDTAYTENDPAIQVDSALTVSDPDDTNIESARVRISSNFSAGDELVFVDTANISGVYNTGTGVLTLTGTDTVANYQNALRSVGFATTSESGATRTVGFQVDDGHSSSNLSNEATKGVAVTPSNDPPVADDETFQNASRAIGNTSLVVNDADDGAPDPAGPQKTVSGDILDGDTDADGPGPLTVTPATTATADGGSVTVEADGDFTYSPPQGCGGGSQDSFDYTVEDNDPADERTDTGTVTVHVADCVWYVDDSAPSGGDGRSHAPYSNLSDLDGPGGAGDEDSSGHRLFLYDGTYSGGLPLENTQDLFTEKHGLVVPDGGGGGGTVTLEQNDGTGSQLNGGLVLASGNSVQGLDISDNAAGASLSGTNVGTAQVNNLTPGTVVNVLGGAVNISTGTLNMAFTTATSTNSAGDGIRLDNTSGTFTANLGTLSNATGRDVDITGNDSGDDVNFTYGGAITDSTGQLVRISDQTGGTKDFNGSVTDNNMNSGGGISLSSNSDSNLTRFDGGLALSTGLSNGLAATNGGTVAVTDANGPNNGPDNTIGTTTGTPLNLSSTKIHADDVTFRSIASNGAANGIVLTNTGSTGGLHVTGTGSGLSGGTILGSTGAAVLLENVGGGVDLSRMSMQNGGDDGVRGTTVTGFSMDNSTVANNGNQTDERGFDFTDLTGTVALNTVNALANREDGFRADNSSGTMNMTVTLGQYSNTVQNDGIQVTLDGTATQNVTINSASFSGNHGDHVQAINNSTTSGTTNLTVNATNMTGNQVTSLGGGIDVRGTQNATIDAAVTNNFITNATSSAANLVMLNGTGSMDATVTGNTISSTVADGILVESTNDTDIDALIRNNVITGNPSGTPNGYNNAGIELFQHHSSTLNASVFGNLVRDPRPVALNGIRAQAGETGSSDTGTLCLDAGSPSSASQKNSIAGSGATQQDIRAIQRGNTTFRLRDYTGASSDTAAVAAYLQNRNNGSGTPTALALFNAAPGFLNTSPAGSACPQP